MSSWSWCDPKDREVSWNIWCGTTDSKECEEYPEEDYWWAADGPQDI